jgi:hypothetical protein
VSDLTGKILGWREWHIGPHGELQPTGLGEGAWVSGVNDARCIYREHEAPDHDCGCGLYAWYEPRGSVGFTMAVGLVAAWGAVELHADGYRAEHAEILCLVADVDEPVLRRMLVDYMADAYKVPVLDKDRALAYARQRAIEVPHDLRPDRQALGSVKPGTISFGVGGTAYLSATTPDVPSHWRRVVHGLRPRPSSISNVTLQGSTLYLASGSTVSSCVFNNSALSSAPFHPGAVARILVAIGFLVGLIAGLMIGGSLV